MEHLSSAPGGAAGPHRVRNGVGLPVNNGWRKASAGLARAEEFAEAGAEINVPKSRAFVAVKRVGSYIGLKPGDLMLLDTLGAFTQAQDWEEGQRPIVWASNAYLMERTGFSLSALKRYARRLAEIGVISFQDSPNGKRWGRRDAEGRIVEAYAEGPVTAATVLSFYADTLPQLGWEQDADGSFLREEERLIIKIREDEDLSLVRFMLLPQSQD